MLENSFEIPIEQLPKTERIKNLTNQFEYYFQKLPDFYVRVPGRVNLIGEHIDYSGYGVCPMALKQDIILAISIENNKILQLYNTNKNYVNFKCDLENFSIKVDQSPEWYQYFLCGIKGIFENRSINIEIKGMNIVVNGIIPESAGLSSSSALVCAAALATVYTNKLYYFKKDNLAILCAKCEQYIGTQGGGMDQAIAFLATEGCAKYIEFSPLKSKDIKLPKGAAFVIAHSLISINKASTVDFNCRVVECRLAAQIIAKKLGLPWQNIKKLGELQRVLATDLSNMIIYVQQLLHKDPYCKEEIIRELETTSDYLDDTSFTQNTKNLNCFKLHQRALHVFQEALRVEKFLDLCTQQPYAEDTLQVLGKLMTDSHESLKNLHECSHTQLDNLVELSKKLTLGCRLTGAGWGGCIVALLKSDMVDKYINTLNENFYKHYTKELNSVVFATTPKSGACIYIRSN